MNLKETFTHKGRKVDLYEDDTFKQIMGGQGNMNFCAYVDNQPVSADANNQPLSAVTLDDLRSSVVEWIDNQTEQRET